MTVTTFLSSSFDSVAFAMTCVSDKSYKTTAGKGLSGKKFNLSTHRPRNKFIISKSIFSKVIQRYYPDLSFEENSKIASYLWKHRFGCFDKYYEYLQIEESKFTSLVTSKIDQLAFKAVPTEKTTSQCTFRFSSSPKRRRTVNLNILKPLCKRVYSQQFHSPLTGITTQDIFVAEENNV
ncbi:Mating-type protein a2 [Komagataella phaffii CBS 7435]|uniref:Mating-type protein a2 n=1 Tax=Komagataella phaffii (strain ATCC 76273 / CBS 7435 / CECT 11047 / NRRL Y-11430 / Wegner 21-1) TaxID=981350 RepID=A0A1G4KQN4_KOMPC|nr:GQ67_05359T0 [Komagataella phaffii]AOA70070.1 GQ68_05255T0 [Komagataella phaffii GS115]CAH2450367.1 Mating-type protein a2 [Komagataella phaffii CBS 7435]SCV12319.1 Mating-type protein a2 [Komagataella phaffii CBS 7435]